jgi:beta-N-acetylhexosaminidase
MLAETTPSRSRMYARRAVLAGLVPGAALAAAAAWLPRRRPAAHRAALPAPAGVTVRVAPSVARDAAPPPLRERIGQMIIAGFRGLEAGPGRLIAEDIAERHLGGVVLFARDVPANSPTRNIESPEQVLALTAQLQSYAATPLLIAVDQEGGLVARLDERHGFPATRSAAELGARDDVDVTYEAGAAIAATLAEAGINLNFAPVVDLNVNPANPVIGALGRSFSADPEAVARHAAAFIRGHRERGVITTLKHFPGHGSSTADSHLGFVDVTDTWSDIELEPYRRLLGEGLVDLVMTAHVFNANLDPTYPATLSHATITGLLRGDLGYGGAVVSDDLQMAAITSQFGFETAVLAAIDAGIDLLLFGNNLVYDETIVARVIDLVEGFVAGGLISEARIDQSYARIMALKAKAGRPRIGRGQTRLR